MNNLQTTNKNLNLNYIYPFLIIFTFFSIFSYSQKNLEILVSDSEKIIIEKNIQNAAQTNKSLICDFEMEKISTLLNEKSINKGTMYYKNPSKLIWESSGTNQFSLIVNDDQVAIKNNKNETITNIKMLKYLGNFIINIINGKSIQSNKEFKTEIYQNNEIEIYNLKLIPIQKKIKDLYSEIIIEIDKKTFLANKIILNENSGDITTIKFGNKKINQKIPDEKFIINK